MDVEEGDVHVQIYDFSLITPGIRDFLTLETVMHPGGGIDAAMDVECEGGIGGGWVVFVSR